MLYRYVKPEIGKYQLQIIVSAKLQELVNKLPDRFSNKLSKNSIEIIFTILKEALRRAVSYQLINNNPVEYVEILAFESKPKKTMNL